MYKTFYDQRSGNTYDIEVDSDGNFVRALRYVDGIGLDPIVYDKIYEIPPQHRVEIEDLIASVCPTSK